MRLWLLVLALSATPALAETDVRAVLIAMAKTSNCILTEDQADVSFETLGLSKDDVRPVAEAMIASGEASLVDGNFHLSPALCAGSAPAAPGVSPLMARVIAVFAANGCALDEEQGLPRLAAAGITEDDLDTLAQETEGLVAAGLIARDEDTRTISIAEPLCRSPVVLSDPAAPLIRMLRENGCSLTQEAAGPLVAQYGMTMATADEMADGLMDRGLAHESGGALVLDDCGG